MNFDNYKAFRKRLKKELDKDRYRHTINVAYTSVCLAMRYGMDLDKAYLAGILHDCAKCYSDKEKYALCKKYMINLSDAEERNPSLVHAKLGPYVAYHNYGVGDDEILSAISWHTTGRPNMSLLERIVFVADYIEPGRYKQKNLEVIRRTAFEDLDTAAYIILRDTMEYLSHSSDCIDENTRLAYEYYKSIYEKGEKH